MENVVTVSYLLNKLQKLSDVGKGDMLIKCSDNFLHEDEIIFDYLENQIRFKGKLCNFEITNRINQFYHDIELAQKKFYNPEFKEYE